MTTKPKKFIILIGIILFSSALLSELPGCTEQPQSLSNGNIYLAAWNAAQRKIDERVPPPFLGNYAPISEVEIMTLGDSNYIFNSYVDMQAATGQFARKYFYAEVKYLGGDMDADSNWQEVKAYIKGDKP